MATQAEDPYAHVYAWLTMGLVAVGIVVNVASLVLLSCRKQKSMFHSLLKVSDAETLDFRLSRVM